MTDQLIHVNIRNPLLRVLTLIPLVLALVGAWFSVRWFIGDTIAENLSPDDRGVETAQMAVRLAPADPLARWTLAEMEQSKFSLDQSGQALAEYEQAVKLSPHDYRFWLALGRALEQSGETGKGEQAMRRAVALAPAYSYPRWYLGNLLLRDGRDGEAFAELRRASEADAQLRPQVFNLILQVYGKNPDETSNAVGSVPETRAEFARYLLERGQPDIAMNIWRGLSQSAKETNRGIGEGLIKTAIDGKHFPQALEIWNDLAVEAVRGKAGQLLDGGFEKDIGGPAVFGWQVKSGQQATAAFDAAAKHGGARSLRLIFKVRSNIDLGVSQLVVVEPGAQYELEGYLKTSKLESAATPVIEIVDPVDGAVLATSPSAPAGFNDWQRLSLPFKTGAKSEAIIIRVSRASCGDNSTCPIFGTLWYDDFDLKRRG
jgi:hypothetical protein